jgi:hypothetical protein
MNDRPHCPWCENINTAISQGIVHTRPLPPLPYEPERWRKLLVYRCLACGRDFDKDEARVLAGS